jgi:hypothetical protein
MTTTKKQIFVKGYVGGSFAGDALFQQNLKESLAGYIYEHTDKKSVVVSNAEELEAAVAAQTAGQWIFIEPGEYQLLASLTIPDSADGGGLIGIGGVVITGAADVDQAVLINHTTSTGTFEYTFAGELELEGGHDKIALKVANGSSTQKTIVYFKDSAHCIDNGTGVAISFVNTGTGAVRLYVNGVGQGFDTINITPKLADDRFLFNNISFDETFTAGAAQVACYFVFKNCQVKKQGMAGGHANQVWSAINCWTEASGVVALAASGDFTGITCDALLPAN